MPNTPDTRQLPPLPADLATPEVWCPIEVRAHPDIDVIDGQLLEWAHRMDLLRSDRATERFINSLFGRFVAPLERFLSMTVRVLVEVADRDLLADPEDVREALDWAAEPGLVAIAPLGQATAWGRAPDDGSLR